MQQSERTEDAGGVLAVVVERPRGSIPVCLIVDDPAPCINPLYYYRLQVNNKDHERHEASVPLDFLEQFIETTTTRGIRGKFSILPYPAGFGSIVDGWDGCDRDEIARWLDLVRTRLVGDWDITPEILTHTRALDLATGEMYPQSEQAWMAERTREELTAYMTAATQILLQAGFVSQGITQPVEFKGNFDDYAHATFAAIQSVGGPDVTFAYIIEDLTGPPYRVSETLLLDRERGTAMVSIMTNCPEHFWATQRPDNRSADDAADRFITADGSGGGLVEMITHDTWLVMVCHWQSLYSDGSRAGLRALGMVADRLAEHYGSHIRWVTTGELALYRAATDACTITAHEDEAGIRVALDAAIACPDFTIALPYAETPPADAEWRGDGGLAIALRPSDGTTPLEPGTWRWDAGRLLLCFGLERGRQHIRLRQS